MQPAALARRPVAVDDLAAVVELLTACDLAVLGRTDFTETEVENDLRNGQSEHQGWYDDAGALVAYGWVWLRSRGFKVGTTFTRMRIDLDGLVEVPKGSGRVAVRRSVADEADQRIAHALDQESFAEHYGEVAQDFDAFHQRFIGTGQFVEDVNAGYVRRLGVTREGRGQGVAKALLYNYFSTARAEGRIAVLLHVDVANVTNALGLYESVGMRPILEIDAWVKRSPVDGVDSDAPAGRRVC